MRSKRPLPSSPKPCAESSFYHHPEDSDVPGHLVFARSQVIAHHVPHPKCLRLLHLCYSPSLTPWLLVTTQEDIPRALLQHYNVSWVPVHISHLILTHVKHHWNVHLIRYKSQGPSQRLPEPRTSFPSGILVCLCLPSLSPPQTIRHHLRNCSHQGES